MIKNGFLTSYGLIASSGSLLFLNVYLYHFLGEKIYGEFVLLNLIPVTIFNFLNFGVPSAFTYFLTKKKIDIVFCFKISIIFSVVMSFIAYLYNYFIFYTENNSMFLLLNITLLVFSFSFINFFVPMLYGVNEYKKSTIIVSTPPMALSVTIIIIDFIFDLISLEFIFLVANLMYLFTLVIALVFFRTLRNNYIIKIPSKRCVSNFNIFYGFHVYLTNILAFVIYRVDIFLITYFLNLESVGFYALLNSLLDKVLIPGKAFTTSLFTFLSSRQNKSNVFDFVLSVGFNHMFLCLILGMLAVIFLYLFSLTDIFVFDFFLIILILLFLVLSSFSRVISVSISSLGFPKYNFYGSIAVLLTNLICGVVLIPLYGLYGVALASIISFSFNIIVRVYCLKFILNASFDFKRFFNFSILIYKNFTNELVRRL